jgi:lipopolysaccharide/colanic/teichoic acid biosynthesis glycosyltransferase
LLKPAGRDQKLGKNETESLMTIFPIIVDSKPAYLEGDEAPRSLALMPCGSAIILTEVAGRLREATRRQPVVLRTFDAPAAYDQALRASGQINEASIPVSAFNARIATYEPSDWLLMVDVRWFSGSGFDVTPLLERLSETPRIARHMVALDGSTSGTNERVELDGDGHVRRVQRYYDDVTWTVSNGVACSLIPISMLAISSVRPFGSLVELRRELVARDLPTRDVPMKRPVLDLTTERGLLLLNERALHERAGSSTWLARSERSAGQSEPTHLQGVHAGAQLVGTVAIHQGAVLEEGVRVIGPAVIGARARLLRGAIVAQSVVAPDAVLAAGSVVRHRVVSGAGSNAVVLGPDHDDPADAVDDFLEQTRVRRVYPAMKAAVEGAIAATALVVLSPVLLLLAAVVKLESRGPIFYGDPRESREGRLFRCFKFRTMYVGADAAQRDLMAANQMDGPQFKLERDPRVTRVGRWLRALSLDELPQLFNVARGQMSLVGPRPSPFRENQMCVPWRDARLSVRPGITGLWQVCRHNRESGDFHQWIYYDIKYVRNMSFLVDLKILIATVLTLGGKGHVPLSWIIPSHQKSRV